MYLNPAGNLSVTFTAFALSGPWLVTIIVQVISSPNLGVALDTNLTTSKSATSSTTVVLFVSFFLSPGVSLVTFATLTIVLLTMFAIVEITNCLDSPLAKSPIIQTPVSGS